MPLRSFKMEYFRPKTVTAQMATLSKPIHIAFTYSLHGLKRKAAVGAVCSVGYTELVDYRFPYISPQLGLT